MAGSYKKAPSIKSLENKRKKRLERENALKYMNTAFRNVPRQNMEEFEKALSSMNEHENPKIVGAGSKKAWYETETKSD